jgi:1-acyl-sn-glycerol-3-phosphate acyltransferase
MYTRGVNIINFAPEFPPFTIVFQLVLALVRLIDWLYYRIRITGRENLRAAGAAVLVSNHTLLLDPGTFVRLLGAVPIPESPGALRTLDATARVALSRLGFIHFFPEGECYRGAQDLHQFHPGAFLLACRLRVPIVPIATVLHEQRWLGRSLRVPPRVSIVVGSPVQPPADLDAPADAQESMQSMIDRAGGSRSFYRAVMPRLVKHDDGRAAQGAARVG